MKIEILNPIEHDGKRFERGIVELGEELAKIFLKYKYAAREAIEKVETQFETSAASPPPAAPAPAPPATPTASETPAPPSPVASTPATGGTQAQAPAASKH